MLDLKTLDKYLIDHQDHQGIAEYTKSWLKKTYYKTHVVMIEVEQWHTQNSYELYMALTLDQGNSFGLWNFRDSCYNYNRSELPAKLEKAQSMLTKVLSAHTMDGIRLRSLGFSPILLSRQQFSDYIGDPAEFNFKE